MRCLTLTSRAEREGAVVLVNPWQSDSSAIIRVPAAFRGRGYPRGKIESDPILSIF
jgi:hypothetical protein